MMQSNCVVRGCGRRSGFGFPSEPELIMKWRIAIKRGPTESGDTSGSGQQNPSPYAVVCEDHFTAEDFIESTVATYSRHQTTARRFLNKGAVPSVFSWRQDVVEPNEVSPEAEGLREGPDKQDDLMDEAMLENEVEKETNVIMDMEVGTENDIRPESEVIPTPMPVSDTGEEQLNELPNEETRKKIPDEMTLSGRLSSDEANIIMNLKMGNQNSILLKPGHDKPRLSYSQLIAEALNQAENRMMPLEDIYVCISKMYPFYRMDDKGWQNSIRHNLSLHSCFYKVPRPKSSTGRGSFWTTNIIQNPAHQKKLYYHHQNRVWLDKKKNDAPDTSTTQKPPKSFNTSNEVQGRFLCWLCHLTFPNRSLWHSHYSKCPSFNLLMCPEPACDYVSRERKHIGRHMISDHIYSSPKLFFCPTCSKNLELKSNQKFQQHMNMCGQIWDLHHTSTEDSELTGDSIHDPSPKQVPDKDIALPPNNGTSDVPIDDITNTSVAIEDFEEIKCHLCEFSLLDTGPNQPMNNGRRRMSLHYNEIHKIRHMRLCEKRGCDFRSNSHFLNRKHRNEEAGHTQCEICGNKIKADRLEQHKKAIHGDVTFDCEYCARPYGGTHQLRYVIKGLGKSFLICSVMNMFSLISGSIYSSIMGKKLMLNM